MALGPSIPRDVEGFVHARKTFYPSRIHIQHHQLRHILTSPEDNIIYYANYTDVYRIDTTTQRRHLVTQLPFEPKCTASGHGYYCAGDVRGHVAFFKLAKSNPDLTTSVDGSLPDLTTVDNESRRLPGMNLDVRVEKLGTDIVNSISIHEVDCPATGPQIVMVLTNNDQSIRLFSLTRGVGMKLDDYPVPMNHASISPDGNRLVAVGDQEMVYFYKKVNHDMKKAKSGQGQWSHKLGFYFELQHRFPLYKAPVSCHPVAAYFTTTWNQSGRLCATASEEGFVTVFDVEQFDEAETVWTSVLAMCPSSRPCTRPGAIRTMNFAPDPWDFLIWTEDHGRVCVGDLRTNISARQVVHLDPKSNDTTAIPLGEADRGGPPTSSADPDTEIDTVRRYHRDVHSDSLARYLTNAQERRGHSNQDTAGTSEDHGAGLSEEEQQILEGLRTSRQREDAHEALSRETVTAMRRQHEALQQESLEALRRHGASSGRPSPRSISYYPSAQGNRIDGVPFSDDSVHPPTSGTSSSSELARLQQDRAVLGSLREYMRDSNYLRRQRPDSSHQQYPRRRNSTGPPAITSASPDHGQTPSDPWQTIEAAMYRPNGTSTSHPDITGQDRGRDSPAPDDDPYPNLPPIQLAQEAHSQLSPRTASDAVSLNTRSQRFESSNFVPRPALPVSVSGAAQPLMAAAEALERRHALTRDRDVLSFLSSYHGSSTAAPGRNSDRANRLSSTALGRYESSLLRRIGRGLTHHESVVALRTDSGYNMPAAAIVDWGAGTTGAAISSNGRMLYVGTEEGIWALEMDFSTRKGRGKIELA